MYFFYFSSAVVRTTQATIYCCRSVFSLFWLPDVRTWTAFLSICVFWMLCANSWSGLSASNWHLMWEWGLQYYHRRHLWSAFERTVLTSRMTSMTTSHYKMDSWERRTNCCWRYATSCERKFVARPRNETRRRTRKIRRQTTGCLQLTSLIASFSSSSPSYSLGELLVLLLWPLCITHTFNVQHLVLMLSPVRVVQFAGTRSSDMNKNRTETKT